MTAQHPKEPTAFDRHVGSRVRFRRMMLGLSQTYVGDAVGVAFQQIQKYERGTNRIGASRLVRVAAVLKVRPEFFFESEVVQRSINPASADFVTKFLATSDGLALANAFQKLSTRKLRRSIVALVENLADHQSLRIGDDRQHGRTARQDD